MNSLINNFEVKLWIFNNLTFITKQNELNENTEQSKKIKKRNDNYKLREDIWGRNIMRTIRPDLKLEKQWTNLFGKYIVKEYFENINMIIKYPKKINGYMPDFEIDNYIIEVKCGTYFTEGTAHEKILGTPFKYCEIPKLYNKPLLIICIGKAEYLGIHKYGFLQGEILNNSKEKQRFIRFYEENNIQLIGYTQLHKLFSD